VLLVVIPLSSHHSDPLCTASLHVHTFSGEDPTTGNSPCFSCVRRCKCPLYKPKTDCLTRVQAAFRPVLYALVMYTSPCTTRCYTRSCLKATDLIFLLNLQAAACCSQNGALRVVRGGETFMYLLIWECPWYWRSVKLRLLSLLLAVLPIPVVNTFVVLINPLNPELNSICYLLALLGAHHFLHVSRIRVKSLTLRLLMSYIYGAPILDVSRSHTTTQHSR